MIVSDKPKVNVFIIKLKNETCFVERYFASANSSDRDEWIEAIERVSTLLDGSFIIEKTVKETQKKIVTLKAFRIIG